MATLITKSIRINDEENEILRQISQQEGVSEAALLKKFIRQGLAAHRMGQAIRVYKQGEADLSAAASFAGVSVYHLMTELKRRDIAPSAEAEKFVDGLKTLVETYGGSDALRQTMEMLAWFKLPLQLVGRFCKSSSGRFTKSPYKVSS